MLRSRVTRRRAVPTLLALALLAGCGGDDDQNAAAPPPQTAAAEAPAATTPPATTQPAPAETQPAQTTATTEQDAPATTAPEKAQAPSADADADAGKDAGLDGAAEAAAASLQAQVKGDYAQVKRLVSARCGKQVTEASVKQMKAAFDALSKQAAGSKLEALVKQLSSPDGWKVEKAGAEAKVTAAEEAGFADYYFVREDGVWKDNTCAHDGAGTSS